VDHRVTTQSINAGIKTGALIKTGAFSLPYSQLSYLAESKQRHPRNFSSGINVRVTDGSARCGSIILWFL
jgi:hypothetical protein